MQNFLYLNPNVVGDPDNGFKFLGARYYGATYIQDGQPSTGGIFGSITNSAPGLDAISEIKVLSNSYSAEYGGPRRRRRHHTPRDQPVLGLGLLRLQQRWAERAAVWRDARRPRAQRPPARTHEQPLRRDLSVDRLAKDRTFFLLNYEGSNQAQVGGGTTISVPTDAMRAGDFSATTLTIIDPRTGLPFPGNRIPAARSTPRRRTSWTSTTRTPISAARVAASAARSIRQSRDEPQSLGRARRP